MNIQRNLMNEKEKQETQQQKLQENLPVFCFLQKHKRILKEEKHTCEHYGTASIILVLFKCPQKLTLKRNYVCKKASRTPVILKKNKTHTYSKWDSYTVLTILANTRM